MLHIKCNKNFVVFVHDFFIYALGADKEDVYLCFLTKLICLLSSVSPEKHIHIVILKSGMLSSNFNLLILSERYSKKVKLHCISSSSKDMDSSFKYLENIFLDTESIFINLLSNIDLSSLHKVICSTTNQENCFYLVRASKYKNNVYEELVGNFYSYIKNLLFSGLRDKIEYSFLVYKNNNFNNLKKDLYKLLFMFPQDIIKSEYSCVIEQSQSGIFEYDFLIKHFSSIKKLLVYKRKGLLSNFKKSYIDYIFHLKLEEFIRFSKNIPSDFLNINIDNTYSVKITVFEIVAITCESEKYGKIIDNCKQEHQLRSPTTDCWYESPDFDAVCCHYERKERCTIKTLPKLSSQGLHITPQKVQVDFKEIKKKHSSIINNLNRPFNEERYSILPSLPYKVGCIKDKKLFSKKGLVDQPQNLPIKFPFTEYRIPKEFIQFSEVIQKISDFWHSVNPEYSDYYYCYFSVAQSMVPSGCFQRRGHLHSDGFQSSWIRPPLPCDFTFVASDCIPTEFYEEAFNTAHLDPSKRNYFKYFKENMKSNPIRLKDSYDIMWMDAYTLHNAMKNEEKKAIRRTFIRVMYSVIRWQSIGKSHNHMFKYTWPDRNRTLLQKLR